MKTKSTKNVSGASYIATICSQYEQKLEKTMGCKQQNASDGVSSLAEAENLRWVGGGGLEPPTF